MAGSKSSPSADFLQGLAGFFAARVAPGETLCLGLSGGRDSVVLLHALSRFGLGARLSALHVHHGLSPNAEAWATFCADLCSRLGVALTVRRVSVEGRSGLGLEAAARQARYQVFGDCGADVLLLAHHRHDQAETLLFNLLRGSGISGAAGMPVERAFHGLRILRPLLAVSRVEISDYARASELDWVEDESNEDVVQSRNYLRHEVMPILESRFPTAQERLAAAAVHFAEADALLAELGQSDWNALASGEGLRLTAARTLSVARLKNLLRWRLRILGWRPPVASRLEEFTRQLIEAGAGRRPQLILPDGEMRVERGVLVWLPAGQR